MPESEFKYEKFDVKIEKPESKAIGKLTSGGKTYYYFRSDFIKGNDTLKDGLYLALEVKSFPIPATFRLFNFENNTLQSFNFKMPLLVNFTFLGKKITIEKTLLEIGEDFKKPFILLGRDDCGNKECRKGLILDNGRALAFARVKNQNDSSPNEDTEYYLPMIGPMGDVVYRKFDKANKSDRDSWMANITTGIAIDILRTKTEKIDGTYIIIYNDKKVAYQKPDCKMVYEIKFL